MHSRKFDKQLILTHVKFRELIYRAFNGFDIHSIEKALSSKAELLALTARWQTLQTSKIDEHYFKSLHYIFLAVFYLIESFYDQLTASGDALSKRNAATANADLFLDIYKTKDDWAPSAQALKLIAKKIKSAASINDLSIILAELSCASLPAVFTIEENRYQSMGSYNNDFEIEAIEKQEEALVISVRFYFDHELWANPQMVKPNLQYSLMGTIRVNHWPDYYKKLILSPVSTTNDEHYILSIPEIEYGGKDEIEINGSVILKYPQPLYEKPLAIKLLARFTGEGKIPLYPLIIGYDQLRVKVTGKDSYVFPTGYDKLNQKAFEMILSIRQALPALHDKELEHFHILLSAILNYQGYCAEFGEYHDKANIAENDFRDNLIRYLSARPDLASSIIKEGQVAGGRVEIRFREIIAELKVEDRISSREKIMDKYVKQSVAYATATSAELSILCILDLTPKNRPPAIAASNVFLRTVELHGFDRTETCSYVVVVFIDGNTPKPSKYKSLKPGQL